MPNDTEMLDWFLRSVIGPDYGVLALADRIRSAFERGDRDALETELYTLTQPRRAEAERSKVRASYAEAMKMREVIPHG